MAIDREQVLHIARLARLHISEDDVEAYRGQLAQILDYVEALHEVDTTDVEPTTHAVDLVMHLREDTAESRLTREEVLQNAPAVEDAQFRVPKVVEGS